MQLLSGVMPVLLDAGLALLVHAEDPFAERPSAPLVDLLTLASPCGVIITQAQNTEYRDALRDLLSGSTLPVTSVAVQGFTGVNIRGDNSSTIKDLMAHLLDQCGVRRPALIRGIPDQQDSVERERLIRREISGRGIVLDEGLVIDGAFEIELASHNLRDLLMSRRDLDAVIAFNDLSAIGAWRALDQAGLRVPEDVVLTGFGNDQVAALNWPGLTTVDNDVQAQGAAAAHALVAQILGEPAVATRPLPGRLVVRGSTGAVRSPEQERGDAIDVARTAQRRLAEQDVLVAFNQAMMRCRTIAEMVETLATTHLRRLGVKRLVLALYEDDAGRREASSSLGTTSSARLLLDYSHGVSRPTPPDPVPLSELLHQELGDAAMVFQQLSTANRTLGYMLLEHTPGLGVLPEILRLDDSRTLEAIFSSEELTDYSLTLEQEIATRRGVEAELRRSNANLQKSLMLDGLTGIPNRAAFERYFEHCTSDTGADQDLALLFVDVDMFKAYNDLYGHVMGDEALCTVASCLTNAVLYPQDLPADGAVRSSRSCCRAATRTAPESSLNDS